MPQGQDFVAGLVEGAKATFLSSLKAANGMSKSVQEGNAVPGDLVLYKKNLGRETIGVLGPVRAHALHYDNDEGKLVTESFDSTSTEYAALQRRAKYWDKGFSAGPEYLTYLPEFETFCMIHFARGSLPFGIEAAQLVADGKTVVKITTEIVGSKRKWPVIRVVEFTDAPEFESAPDEMFAEAFEQFVKPTTERAAKPAGRSR